MTFESCWFLFPFCKISDVASIRIFPWEKLNLSTSSMIIIIGWLTWKKMTINSNTNTPREWVITFLNKNTNKQRINKIHYTNICNIAQLTTIHVNLPYYHLNLFLNHQSHYTWITYSIQDVTTLTNFIINHSQVLCNNYIKTQAYMQCDIMFVKNNTKTLRST